MGLVGVVERRVMRGKKEILKKKSKIFIFVLLCI